MHKCERAESGVILVSGGLGGLVSVAQLLDRGWGGPSLKHSRVTCGSYTPTTSPDSAAETLFQQN